jgi:hypothetical protein
MGDFWKMLVLFSKLARYPKGASSLGKSRELLVYSIIIVVRIVLRSFHGCHFAA